MSVEGLHSSDFPDRRENVVPHQYSKSFWRKCKQSIWKIQPRSVLILVIQDSLQCCNCNWSFIINTFQGFVFPISAKALVKSHSVRAWKDGKHLKREGPREEWMVCSGMYLSLSFAPVWSHNSWQPKSLKWATASTAMSVSGDCVTIRGCVDAACLACGTAAVLPWARETVLDPSVKPPANKTLWKGPKCPSCCLMRFSQTNSANLSLFLGLEINFIHCFRIGVDPLWILTSKELASPRFFHSPTLMESGPHWSKIKSTRVQLFCRNVRVTMASYFCNNSPNVADLNKGHCINCWMLWGW